MKSMKSSIFWGALVALAAGCSSDDVGSGSLEVTTWGEEYIEEEIPAEDLADGYSIKFDKFLIVLGKVRGQATSGDDSFVSEETVLFDLVTPGPHRLAGFDALEAGDWERVGYSNPPIDETTTRDASASAKDATLMRDGGYSVYVEGSATQGEDSYHFAWGFTHGTDYENCITLVDGREQPGFTVGEGARTTVELTIHGDHFFYDDLASPDAERRFQAYADADANEDGEVTLEELAEVKLFDIPSDQGPYGTGDFSRVDNLREFMGALVSTLGHFNGEGHCEPQL